MNLRKLVEHIGISEIRGTTDREVTSVEFDSRKVNQNCAFVARRGLHVDGHRFIPAAVEKGAVAVFFD